MLPKDRGMTHHSIIYAVQHTHYSDSESNGRNRNSAYSSYFSKRPILTFHLYISVKGSFSPRVFSSLSYQFPLRVGLPFQLTYFVDNVSFKMIICLKFKLIKVTYPIKNILGSRTTF